MAYRAAIVGGSGYTGAELLAPAGRAPRYRGRAGHRRLERRRLGAAALPVAGRCVSISGLRAAAGRRPRRPRRRLPRAAARPVAGDRGIARRHGGSRRRSRCRLPAPARRLRAVVRRDAYRTGAARPLRVRPARAVPRRHRRCPPRRRARLLSDDRCRSRSRHCCATGSSSRRASWSMRCPACRGPDAV